MNKDMNPRKIFFFEAISVTLITAAIIAALLSIASCSKSKDAADVSLFYGTWRSNAGDTLTFFQSSGKNNCDAGKGSPAPVNREIEFSYSNNKLGLKDGAGEPGKFRILKTFAWIQKGSSFEVQGNDIYCYMSSLSTYTFIKIP